MPSLVAYLPSRLLEHLARGRIRERRVAAALLFADISGFTALTEKRAASGRAGAEEVARVINRAFRPAIRAITEEGGTILSFGGDALFAMFVGGSPVRRAETVAGAIREHLRKRGQIATKRGLVDLSVSQAIHGGKVRELHLSARDRRHYLVVGASVQALARLESRASAGEILLSRQARAHRAKECRPRKRRATQTNAAAKLLIPYLDPRLQGTLRGFRGSFRRAATLFLETKGTSKAALNGWFAALGEVLARYDGMLLKSDLSPCGTKWICLFGLPKAHENDPDRASRAALELVARLPRGLAVRGGLHAGLVANVVIGTGFRKSFDVMGDTVNTAARVMGEAALGEILVTEEFRKQLAGAKTRDRGQHTVKGKKKPLHLHALEAMETGVKALHVSAPMVGRDRELATIIETLDKARAGEGAVIGIEGEAGMGKSRLKYEAAKRAREMGFGVHEGRAVTFTGMPYWTIAALVKAALGLPEAPAKAALVAGFVKSREYGRRSPCPGSRARACGSWTSLQGSPGPSKSAFPGSPTLSVCNLVGYNRPPSSRRPKARIPRIWEAVYKPSSLAFRRPRRSWPWRGWIVITWPKCWVPDTPTPPSNISMARRCVSTTTWR